MKPCKKVRARGGFLIHLLEISTRESLCGHKPSGTTNMGRGRAGWTSVESAPITRMCEKCQKRFDKDPKCVIM